MKRKLFPLLILPFLMSMSSAPRPDLSDPIDWSMKFQKEITEIENLQKAGKNRSAFELSTSIIDQSLKANNIPGIVFGMRGLIDNAYFIEEEALAEEIKKLAGSLPGHPVTAAFFRSYLAEVLTGYFERIRYTLPAGQSEEPVLTWEDFDRWSSLRYEQEIDSLYLWNGGNKKAFDIPTGETRFILREELKDVSLDLRPRVYDLLQDRFIAYLSNHRLHRNVVEFVAGENEAQGLTAVHLSDFLKGKEGIEPSFYRTMLSWHEWEESLIRSGHREAWLDVILHRLDFVKNSIPEAWDSTYINRLEWLLDQYGSLNNGPDIALRIAGWRIGKQDPAGALEILKSTLDRLPEESTPYYRPRILSQIRQIQTPTLRIETEEAYPIRRYPLISIQYKNLEKVRLRLHSLPENDFIRWQFARDYPDQKSSKKSFGQKVWETEVSLPVTEDFKEHQTEWMIEEYLPYGGYLLHFEAYEDSVKIEGNILFQVTDLALTLESGDCTSNIFVFNRNSGRRMEDARVEVNVVETYPDFKLKETQSLRKKNGGYVFPEQKMSNIYYKVKNGADQYISPLSYYQSPYPYSPEPYRRTVLFTDRAIYKPGDIIHFKAMTVLTRRLTTDLLKNQTVKMALRDANGREVWSEKLNTDEWGTVTGTAVIPRSGLKGMWVLSADPSGSAQIQIEEYIRPNFEVKVEDDGVSPYDNQINIKGKAETYSGFPIQKGKGEVEVSLQERRWFFMDGGEKTPFAHLSFTTDENGDFDFSFRKPDIKKRPVWRSFYYHVKVRVEAESGEIREWEREIPLDPDMVLVTADPEKFYEYETLKPFRFSVKNILNTPSSKDVRWELVRLDAPDRWMTDRYWPVPDKFLIDSLHFYKSQDRFYRDHPSDPDQWPVTISVAKGSTVLRDGDDIDLKPYLKQGGYYRMILRSPDQEVLHSFSFGVFPSEGSASMVHRPMILMPEQTIAYPGDSVRIAIRKAPGLEDAVLYISRSSVSEEKIFLSDQEEILIEVSDKDRGGIELWYFGYLNGRYFQETLRIDVPWNNKDLKIVPERDWDQLDVNSDTSLIIKTADDQGNSVASEIAIVIYDASLDAYVPHSWQSQGSFFRYFSSALNVRDLTGRTGNQREFLQDDARGRIDIPKRGIPELLEINPYRNIMFATRGRMSMQKNIMMSAAPAPAVADEAMAVTEGEYSAEASGAKAAEVVAPHLRKDFDETLLFRGKVKTGDGGFVKIPFKTNDKTGRWKVLVFGHTPDMMYGESEFTFETSRDIYIEDYLPEVARQGDRMEVNYTLFNTTDGRHSGSVEWEIFSLSDTFPQPGNRSSTLFSLNGKGSQTVRFTLSVDENRTEPLVVRTKVVSETGAVLDMTEKTVMVLPAVQRIAEGKVLVLKEGETLTDESWKHMKISEKGVQIRVVQNMYSELTKSIPYMHIPNPVTTDQYFRNWSYASMGKFITGNIPGFEAIYKEWKRKGELISRLAQNTDLKYTELTHTPWVRQSDSGTEQMARLGLYFDHNYMQSLVQDNLDHWKKSQNADGGFPWIEGGNSSFYITGSFLSQLGKMKWAGVPGPENNDAAMTKAVQYMDQEFLRAYKNLKKKNTPFNYRQYVDYFVVRSYYPLPAQEGDWDTPWSELMDSIYNHWAEFSVPDRAAVGVAALNLGNKRLGREISNGFLDNAVHDSELGIYWRTGQERNADYLQVLSRITELLWKAGEAGLNDGIRQWILVNKMTNDWHSNPNVFSLMLSLLKMETVFSETSVMDVLYDGQRTSVKGLGDTEAWNWNASKGSFSVTNRNGAPVWVGILTDREVQPGELKERGGDILKIRKEIFFPGKDGEIKRGDRVVVRLEIESDRDLSYIFIEDPLVPGVDSGINLSGYRWNMGLSYYQSFGFESVRFFIEQLRKGRYVIEYELGAVRSGEFVSPASVIQSYFVPEIAGYDPGKSRISIGD